MTASVSNFRLRVITPEERRRDPNPDVLYICMGDSKLKEAVPAVLEVFDQWAGEWKRVHAVRT